MLKGLFQWHNVETEDQNGVCEDEDFEPGEEEMAEVMGKSSSLDDHDNPGKGTTFDLQFDCPYQRWWVVYQHLRNGAEDPAFKVASGGLLGK